MLKFERDRFKNIFYQKGHSQLSPGIILMSGVPMTVACYKVNYLPVGVRIRFRVNFNPFLAIFGHFYPISLSKFALTLKTRPPQFT